MRDILVVLGIGFLVGVIMSMALLFWMEDRGEKWVFLVSRLVILLLASHGLYHILRALLP